MWAYRIQNDCVFQGMEFTRQFDGPNKLMAGRAFRVGTDPFPHDNVHTVTIQWEMAKRLWRQLKWDSRRPRSLNTFVMPGTVGFSLGFVLETADQIVFLATPYPCEHIRETLDWDAFTDSEEISRAREAILGGTIQEPTTLTPMWQRSNKGNLYAEIGSSVATVFRDAKSPSGYKGVVSFGSLKCFTPTMQSEHETCAYVIQHYERLKAGGIHIPFNRDDPWADERNPADW